MSDEVSVRPYRSDDLDAVACITRRAWGGVTLAEAREQRLGIVGQQGWRDHKEHEIRHFCARHPDCVLVAEVGGVSGETIVAGYASWLVSGDRTVGTVGNNAVDPDWQRRGIGAALVSAVIARMEAAEVEVLQVQTMLQDEPARRLYQRLGFDEIGRTVHFVRRPDAAGAGR